MVKRGIVAALLFASGFLGLACQEEFSPKGEVREQIIVYATATAHIDLRIPTSFSAVVMRSFDVEGVNPAGSTIDPSIRGATVRISGRGTTITLREMRRAAVDSLSGVGPRWYYGGSAMTPRMGDSVSLLVDLPDGRRISGRTTIPAYRNLTIFPEYRGVGVSGFVDAYFFGTAWVFDWESVPGDQHLFFPRLELIYERMDDSGAVALSREVPLRFLDRNGSRMPQFPGPATSSETSFAFDAMNATMEEISAGDPEKGRYRILSFRWHLLEYDFPLSRYYASVNGFLDAYSVRLDEPVFSNIQGGIGILGSAGEEVTDYPVDPRYAARFGYAVR